MFKFLVLLRRFIPPYKKYVVLSLLSNLLSTVLSLFSFATIIPILQILFGIRKSTNQYIQWSWSSEWNDIVEAIKNNLSYQLQEFIASVGPSWALFYLGVFLVVMTFFKVGTAYLGTFFIIPIRTGVLRDLRNQMYSKVLALPIGFFSEERKGDIMSRMTGDVSEVEISIMSSLDFIFKNPVMITVYLGVMFWMSWQLTVFVMLLLPLSGLVIGKIGKSLKTTSTKGQEQTGELLSQIEETLGGLRVIKAFNAEFKLEDRFSTHNNRLRNTHNSMNRRYSLAHPVSELMGTMVIAILLWFGGSIILSHNSMIDASQFIYYLVIFYSIIAPAKDLSRAAYSIQKGFASLERVDLILKTDNQIKDPASPQVFKKFSNGIEFRNLSFKYKNDWVLRNINLTVPKGSTVALVGQSGSGKSTLVDLLPRFYDAVEGEVLIDGVNVKDYRVHDVRSQMGNVNQEAILFNDSFYNNIARN